MNNTDRQIISVFTDYSQQSTAARNSGLSSKMHDLSGGGVSRKKQH